MQEKPHRENTDIEVYNTFRATEITLVGRSLRSDKEWKE